MTMVLNARVSVAALLRVHTADGARLILVNTGKEQFEPLGGALTYLPDAAGLLDELGWRAERSPDPAGRVDLRGVLPLHSLPVLFAWLGTGHGRERAEHGLRRELGEELAAAVDTDLAQLIAAATFAPVRTVVEKLAAPALDRPCWQTRWFEIFGFGAADPLQDYLAALAEDPSVPGVCGASWLDISRGRVGSTKIAPQTCHLSTAATAMPGVPVIPSRQMSRR